MKRLDDVTIINKLKSPNKRDQNEAIAVLRDKELSVVYKMVLNNNGSKKDAEDIVQDSLFVFIKQLRLKDFSLSCSLGTYLYSIGRNLWLKQLRKRKKEIPLIDDKEYVVVDDRFLEDFVVTEENHSLVYLLKKLKPECRELLLLFYYEGLSIKDLKRHMGFASDQVTKNKKYNCLKKLRALASKLIPPAQ